jgi:hypothetical protein
MLHPKRRRRAKEIYSDLAGGVDKEARVVETRFNAPEDLSDLCMNTRVRTPNYRKGDAVNSVLKVHHSKLGSHNATSSQRLWSCILESGTGGPACIFACRYTVDLLGLHFLIHQLSTSSSVSSFVT